MPNRILHPLNRKLCPREDVFRPDVEKLIEGVREILKDPFGLECFSGLMQTANNPVKNANELRFVLDVLTQHQLLQLEGYEQKKHQELIHMAISEVDKSRERTIGLLRGLRARPLDR